MKGLVHLLRFSTYVLPHICQPVWAYYVKLWHTNVPLPTANWLTLFVCFCCCFVLIITLKQFHVPLSASSSTGNIIERFSTAGPRGTGREWATLGVHPLSWLLSNNRLEKVPFVSVLHTSSNRLLLSNQDKGCTPSVAHSLPLPLGPALLNLWTSKLC